MGRGDTDRTFALSMLHDENCCCEACRSLTQALDTKVQLLERDFLFDVEMGKLAANRITAVEARVATLETKRAKSEGTAEAEDRYAREQAAAANKTADKTEGKVAVVGWAVGIVAIIEALNVTGVIPALVELIKRG